MLIFDTCGYILADVHKKTNKHHASETEYYYNIMYPNLTKEQNPDGTGAKPEIQSFQVGDRVANLTSDFRHSPRCISCGELINYPRINPLTNKEQYAPNIHVDIEGTIVNVRHIPTHAGTGLIGDMEPSDPHVAYTVYCVVFDGYPGVYYEFYSTWNNLQAIER